MQFIKRFFNAHPTMMTFFVVLSLLFYVACVIEAGVMSQARSNPYANMANNAMDKLGVERMVRNDGGVGCAHYLLQSCATLSLPIGAIDQSKVISGVLEAIRHPCHYLANPLISDENDEVMLLEWKKHPNNKSDWEYFGCGEGMTIKDKVILNVYDRDRRTLIIRIVKP